MARFQLNTKIIPEDHKIWLVYAGKRRRFFDFFYTHSCIFTSNPGFVPSANIFSDEAQVRQFVRLTRSVYNHISGRDPNPPTRRLDYYSNQHGDHKTKEGRAFNSEVGNVQRLFNEVKTGDLVISPAEGHYNPMLIGEVKSPWDSTQYQTVSKLQGENVPCRSVNWIRADLSRRDFPLNVAKALQNPHAVSEFDSKLYNDVYRTVYPSYMASDRSKIDLFAPKYSGHDPTETHEGGLLIKYFIAAYIADEQDRIREFADLQSSTAIQRFYDPSLVLEFRQNFNSPGEYSLVASNKRLAAVVGLAIYLSVDPAPLDTLLGNFTVTESATNQVTDEAQNARAKVQGLVDGMGRDRFEQEIREGPGREAREKLGLSSSITKQN